MSARWWFENRETGDITIAQFPNWPLWGIGIISLVTLAAQQGDVDPLMVDGFRSLIC